MKKVLYISNIEVPYRTEFFNQLAEFVDLTVLYERKKSSNRDNKWANSIDSKYNKIYLKGINYKNEYTFDLRILKYCFSKDYDCIIIGCYNSISQIIAYTIMKLFGRKYILNLDGEYFFDGKGIIKMLKRKLIIGADKYLIAGDCAAKRLAKYVDKEKIFSYPFSSLTKKEIEKNMTCKNNNLNNTVLVVGQYFDYKGLDLAIKVAKIDKNHKYKFIGSGRKSNLLKEKIGQEKIKNIEVIPFLTKKDLYKEYQKCLCLLLPSRKECWGLVVNEAASFGCPIVSTQGSGAAVEFLSGKYDIFMAKNSNAGELKKTISTFFDYDGIDKYKKYLIEKSKKYNIENNVKVHLKIINESRSTQNEK